MLFFNISEMLEKKTLNRWLLSCFPAEEKNAQLLKSADIFPWMFICISAMFIHGIKYFCTKTRGKKE